MLHRPTDAQGKPVEPIRSVVLCPPFAEEEKCSRRLYVELSRALARRGVASLRFSYRGTADSEGQFSDLTVEGALQDTGRAIACLKQEYPHSPMALFGLRLGGAFAMESLRSHADVQRISVWSPVTNGRSYVRMNFRRKAIRQMMNTGAASSVQTESAIPENEIFDFDGYPVARALWDQLEALHPGIPTAWQGQVQIVSIGSIARPSTECTNLSEALAAAGVQTSLECVVSQPFWNLLGLVECPEIIELTAQSLSASP